MKFTKAADTVKEQYMGITFEIARTNNNAFRAKYRKLSRPYRTQIEKRTIADDLEIELICKALAGTVLVGWDGAKTEDGKDWPFTEENATEVLIDDVDFREFVTETAGNLSIFVDQETEALKKKRPQSSTGN